MKMKMTIMNMNMEMVMNTELWYCVWSNEDKILCLTSDYGIAVDVLGNHMVDTGYVTDDSWADATARIEEFDTIPDDRNDIIDFLTLDEYNTWYNGGTVMM